MKFVSFLDSFFILSLGITFSLLLGLIYHFRNRLNENEKKYEQLLSIVNDIVKKLNEQNAQSSNISQNIYYNNEFENEYLEDEEDDITNSMHDTIALQYSGEDNYDEDDFEEGEEDDDEEDDDDEDYDEDDDEGDEEDDEEEEIKNNNLEILDETLSQDEEVKVVNLNDVIELDNNIKVEEDDETPIIDEPELNDIEPLDENAPSVKVEKSLEINYNLLNVSELKKIIKDKEINVSISKMKKQDLIQLLESNE